jgi:hypothetical protein
MTSPNHRKRRVAKRKSEPKPGPAATPETFDDAQSSFPEDRQIGYSNASLHDLFAQQTREMLDHADLDEEQKQSILIAMSCPCCGAGGMSYTVKIKRRP